MSNLRVAFVEMRKRRGKKITERTRRENNYLWEYSQHYDVAD